MPYVIFTANGEEYDRRELTGPIVLGRAPDCDVSIPDITLSRHHCRIEPSENGRAWQLVDLHSKNGTHFLGQKVETHVLRDKDELRIGRTRLTFRAGAFVPSNKVKSRGVIRPVDPHEALAGTVTGMVLCEPGETEKYEGMPVPQPRPTDPMSFQKEDIYGMINEIASSSWDSIQAQASQPTRMQRAQPVPVPAVAPGSRGPLRPKPRVSFALQAEHEAGGGNGSAAAQVSPTPASAPPPMTLEAPPEPGAAGAAVPDAAPAVDRAATPPAAAAASAEPQEKAASAKLADVVPSTSRTRWKFPRVPQRVALAMATAAVVALLFAGWVGLLLHMTRDTGTTVPRPGLEAPASVPDVQEAAQSAALVPFAEAL